MPFLAVTPLLISNCYLVVWAQKNRERSVRVEQRRIAERFCSLEILLSCRRPRLELIASGSRREAPTESCASAAALNPRGIS